jgi:hypothetical protein
MVKQKQQPVPAEREATGDWTATRLLRVFVVSAGDSSDVSGIEEELMRRLAGYVGLIAG